MNSTEPTLHISVKYEAGHSYDEEWEPLSLFCPACGKKEVWHETGPGDYYEGEEYLCRSCGAKFYLPGGVFTGHGDSQDQQRLTALRGYGS